MFGITYKTLYGCILCCQNIIYEEAKKKNKFQKVTDKVEKREEEQYQGMAIRGIINKNKQKEQEEKNRTTNTGLTSLHKKKFRRLLLAMLQVQLAFQRFLILVNIIQ
jgi:hypothetical protein